MKVYKYFYKVIDENGHVIFDHKGNDAARLLKLAEKASHDDSGAMFCDWYSGRVETNIPDAEVDEEDEQDYEEAFSWLKDLPDEENL